MWSRVQTRCPGYQSFVPGTAQVSRAQFAPWRHKPVAGIPKPFRDVCSKGCQGAAGLHHPWSSRSLSAQDVLIFHEAPSTASYSPASPGAEPRVSPEPRAPPRPLRAPSEPPPGRSPRPPRPAPQRCRPPAPHRRVLALAEGLCHLLPQEGAQVPLLLGLLHRPFLAEPQEAPVAAGGHGAGSRAPGHVAAAVGHVRARQGGNA